MFASSGRRYALRATGTRKARGGGGRRTTGGVMLWMGSGVAVGSIVGRTVGTGLCGTVGAIAGSAVRCATVTACVSEKVSFSGAALEPVTMVKERRMKNSATKMCTTIERKYAAR
jgi:hypothetical protein